MQRVILTRAPNSDGIPINQEGRCQYPVTIGFHSLMPPLSSLYVASLLTQAGHTVKIIDCQAKWAERRPFIDAILEWGATVVGFQTGMFSVADDVSIAKEIKTRNPGITTVFFDEYATAIHTELATFNGIDIVVRGDPEIAFVDIASRKNIHEISGITFNHNGTIIVNPDGHRPNLDDLPLPALELVNTMDYLHWETGRPYTLLQISRGCPSQCTFCTAPLYYGSQVRYRSAKSIIVEIEDRIERFKIRDFNFYADTFTLNKKLTTEICSEIISRGIHINFWANSRVDTIDEEILYLLKQSGCSLIGFGLESGDMESLKLMKKGITLEQSRKAIELCRKCGIQSAAFMMIGFPWETKEQMKKTYEFANAIDPDWVQFATYVPFPGTQMTKEFQDKNLILSNNPYDSYTLSMVTTEHETAQSIKKMAIWSFIRFYSKPHRIIRYLRRKGRIRLVKAILSYFVYRLFSKSPLRTAKAVAIGLEKTGGTSDLG